MTAQVIDFSEAKEKILGRGTKAEPATVSADLSNALEEFSFSRLPKLERIQRFFVSAMGEASPEVILLAELVQSSLPDDVFLKPFRKA